MIPHLCKPSQSKLKYNILQQTVVHLVYKVFVFELAYSYSSIFAKDLLAIFGVVCRF